MATVEQVKAFAKGGSPAFNADFMLYSRARHHRQIVKDDLRAGLFQL